MNWNEYEKALTEKLRYQFRPPVFTVIHNMMVEGVYSKGQRQVDVAVCRAGERYPFLAVEAKHHGDTLDIGYIDAFITKLQEVKAKWGLMVVASGYSAPGKRLAEAFGISLEVMSAEEAFEMQWLPVARSIFPWDWAYHPELAVGLYRLQNQDNPQSVTNALEAVPFEEWLAFVRYALKNHSAEAREFLWFVALHHYDNGWRFNAVQTLIEHGSLGKGDAKILLSAESDPDILELLREAIQ